MINDEWKIWIWENVKKGVKKQTLADRLFERGFSITNILNEINILPSNLQQKENCIEDTIKNLNFFKAKPLEEEKLKIFKIEELLTEKEAKQICTLIKNNAYKSRVMSKSAQSKGRESMTCLLERVDDPVIRTIKSKILGLMGLPYLYTEPLQGQWYETGGFYNQHYDAFDKNKTEAYEKVTKIQGNRTWTVMINLNKPKEGGETEFSKLNLKIPPKVGQAIIWYNLLENKERNINSLHGGLPVIKGEKIILTWWFRQKKRV